MIALDFAYFTLQLFNTKTEPKCITFVRKMLSGGDTKSFLVYSHVHFKKSCIKNPFEKHDENEPSCCVIFSSWQPIDILVDNLWIGCKQS